ncbi:glycosyl transferase [Marivirga lumbricoides]|uniref:Glycosyl transferase n=1 Tax=Marivirga lumbricoides TaxID=1046115 RepID=A0ABQ1MKA1_9BACT|nr:glycosyl transferase [Marivirga lumbricoides]
MSNPLVSIISVHFNGTKITEEFIKSILQISYSPVEVFIVDNGSEQEPLEPLTQKYPEIKFIISEKNLGFAGGNNLAIKQASGEYLLFINNDTEVPINFLEPLIDHFLSHPNAGMASPLIKYFNTNIIQYAGNSKVNLLTGRSKRLGFKEEDHGQYDFNFKTGMIHGAALLVRDKVIEEIGLMPESFFLYYEELDWCTRAQKKGYETWVIGKSTIFHKESMSVGKNSPFKLYYMTRNRILFLRRNTEGVKRLSWVLFFLIFTMPKSTLLYIFKRDFQSLKSFYKGVFWNLAN